MLYSQYFSEWTAFSFMFVLTNGVNYVRQNVHASFGSYMIFQTPGIWVIPVKQNKCYNRCLFSNLWVGITDRNTINDQVPTLLVIYF